MKTFSCSLLGGRQPSCDEDNTLLITAGYDSITVDVFVLQLVWMACYVDNDDNSWCMVSGRCDWETFRDCTPEGQTYV